jgi:hypothetical protein
LTADTGATRQFLVLFGMHLKATNKHCNEFTFLSFVSSVESNSIVSEFICVIKLLESNRDVFLIMYTDLISLLLLQP